MPGVVPESCSSEAHNDSMLVIPKMHRGEVGELPGRGRINGLGHRERKRLFRQQLLFPSLSMVVAISGKSAFATNPNATGRRNDANITYCGTRACERVFGIEFDRLPKPFVKIPLGRAKISRAVRI